MEVIAIQEDVQRRVDGIASDKRDRILNAAMAEFCKGYKQASTDVIVREAGISKGLLFHYFGSKKALFLFLQQYAVRLILDDYFSLINVKERDMLERWRQSALLKFDLIRRHPALFEFVTRGFLDDDPEVAQDVRNLKGELMGEFSPQVFQDVDTSLFRTDIPPDQVKEMIEALIVGLSERQTQGRKTLAEFDGSYDAMLAKVDAYVAVMRKCFYREGEMDGGHIDGSAS